MLVCDDPAFVAYLPPKTGCVSLIRALRSQFGRSLYCLPGPGQYHAAGPLFSKLDHFHFLVVRNPYRRAVSWWWHYRTVKLDEFSPLRESRDHRWPSEDRRLTFETVRRQTFRQFLHSPATRSLLIPCGRWLEAMPRVDRVLRTEELDRDFANLPFTDAELPRLNRGAPGYGDWQTHYDSDCERIVGERFAEDFDRFGYVRSLDAA